MVCAVRSLQERLAGSLAQTMQAVPDMLEVVPVGWNKWVALQELLDHMQVGVLAVEVSACCA